MFSASIVKKSNNFVRGYPTEFAGSTQKYNVISRTPNQSIKSKKIKKRYVNFSIGGKELKICMEASSPNLPRVLKNIKTQVKLKKS
jgi:hypothetical protein